ncbi:unnamed protein product, partial [Owenia fusiformis]
GDFATMVPVWLNDVLRQQVYVKIQVFLLVWSWISCEAGKTDWSTAYMNERLCPTEDDYVIQDQKVMWYSANRAKKTLPQVFRISTSKIPGAGLGVFSEKVIPVGTFFGPYQGDTVPSIEDVRLSGDYTFIVYRNGSKYFVDAWNPDSSNWLRYVNCARDLMEQNLESIPYGGNIYYRSIQAIYPGQELLVFYGHDYLEKLDIPIHNYCKWFNGTVHQAIWSDFICGNLHQPKLKN